MVRRFTLRTLAVLILLGLALGPAPRASASTEWIHGSMNKETWSHYSNARYVDSYASKIFFQKTAGSGMWIGWKICSGNVGGANYYFSDADPTARKAISLTLNNGIYFCLRAKSNGVWAYDSFDGLLNWNVYS